MNTLDDFNSIDFIFEEDRVQKLHPKGDTILGREVTLLKQQIKNNKPGNRWTGRKCHPKFKSIPRFKNDQFNIDLFKELKSNPIFEKEFFNLLEKHGVL